MMGRLAIAIGLALLAAVQPARAEEGDFEHQAWPWLGVFGQYDRAQLKRGFQVYHEVCSACHSLNQVAYRDLASLGFTEDEIKAVAAEKQVPGKPDDTGDPTTRPAAPADHFVSPFPNEQAARAANNGALPPDLSLIVKARAGGPDYVYAMLTGFADPPEGFELMNGMYYNRAFPGHQMGMPPQVEDDRVTYSDGTKATKEQIAKDVVAFLNWTAEPELDQRHRLGLKVLIFLAVLTAMVYALKRRIWADVH